MQRLGSQVREFRRNDRGGILVFFAISLLMR